jgi:hypothetical protein
VAWTGSHGTSIGHTRWRSLVAMLRWAATTSSTGLPHDPEWGRSAQVRVSCCERGGGRLKKLVGQGRNGYRDQPQGAQRRARSAISERSYGMKISLAEEAEPPGVGPPEMTAIRPPTATAPSPCLAVGIAAYVAQLSVCGSYAST